MSRETTIRCSGSSVRVEGSRLIKSSAPGLMALEVARTRAAGDLARDCGLFRVPTVLEHDKADGEAAFEYLPDLVRIRHALCARNGGAALARRLGRILAVVHRDLRLPDELAQLLPAPWDDADDPVFIHGDMSLVNLYYRARDDEIVVLDWQTSHFFDPRSTTGSRYFDLACLTRNLYLWPPVGILWRDCVTPALREVLAGYRGELPGKFDVPAFHRLLSQMAADRDEGIVARSAFPYRILQRLSRRYAWSVLDRPEAWDQA